MEIGCRCGSVLLYGLTIAHHGNRCQIDQLNWPPLLLFVPGQKLAYWWLSESLSDAQRYQVKDLLAKLSGLRERTQALLDLLAELRLGTIDRILEIG